MSPAFCLLPQRACVEVRGADATAFLHGQLSRTIDQVGVAHAPLAGWLDARGRVRALFRVLRLDDGWLLITERDVAAHAAQKLRMFVLRAEVTIAPSDDWTLAAVVDPGDALEHRGPPADAPRDAVVQHDELRWLRIGPGLWHLLGTRRTIEAFDPSIERAPPEVADLAEIRLGIPSVGAAVADRHVAQMLRLDELGAVSFDKGCYPGQEVVARVKNLGAVKRHLRHYESGSAILPAAGTAVLAAEQPVGELVRAAPTHGGFEALAVVEDAAAGAALTLDGAPLRELPLPQ